MPPISVMIKPASSNCNLRCKYCFYHDLAANREMPSHGFMSEKTLRDVLKKAFDFADGSQVSISFQGGEPLLAGKEFYRDFAKILPEYNLKNSAVYVGVQTNGTLIDEEWCDIFKSAGYLAGLSLDGDEIADSLRVDAFGNPTFGKTYAAAKLMQAKGVEFNVLTVVTKQVAKNITRVYEFFKKNGFKHLQFIPCLRPMNNADKGKIDDEFFLTSEDYEFFLKNAFALYLRDYREGNYISVRLFDNFVRLARFERAEQCGMNGHCTHQYVAEADGEIYPCDFYCLDEYSLGNIADTDFFALERHPKAVKFIEESLVIEEKCKGCNYFRLCKNGCKRERVDLDKCAAYKNFFPHALPYLRRMS